MSVGLGNLKLFIYLSMFDRSIGLGISFFTVFHSLLSCFALFSAGEFGAGVLAGAAIGALLSWSGPVLKTRRRKTRRKKNKYITLKTQHSMDNVKI